MTNLNYDTNNDVLYLSFTDQGQSYGDEIVDGYVVMKDFISDEITGITIFDFMTKYRNNQLINLVLPIDVDYTRDIIPNL